MYFQGRYKSLNKYEILWHFPLLIQCLYRSLALAFTSSVKQSAVDVTSGCIRTKMSTGDQNTAWRKTNEYQFNSLSRQYASLRLTTTVPEDCSYKSTNGIYMNVRRTVNMQAGRQGGRQAGKQMHWKAGWLAKTVSYLSQQKDHKQNFPGMPFAGKEKIWKAQISISGGCLYAQRKSHDSMWRQSLFSRALACMYLSLVGH